MGMLLLQRLHLHSLGCETAWDAHCAAALRCAGRVRRPGAQRRRCTSQAAATDTEAGSRPAEAPEASTSGAAEQAHSGPAVQARSLEAAVSSSLGLPLC